MIKYEITKQNEDITKAVITKSGHTHDLTIADVISHIKDLIKLKKEMEGNYFMAKAFMHNIESNHPYIKKLDEKQRETLFLYGQKSGEAKDAHDALNIVEEQVNKYNAFASELVKQIGLPEDSELHKALEEFRETVSEAKKTFNEAFNKSKEKKNGKNTSKSKK